MADIDPIDDDSSEPTWQTCVRCGKPVHLNFVDYEALSTPTADGETLDFTRPFHADGCPEE